MSILRLFLSCTLSPFQIHILGLITHYDTIFLLSETILAGTFFVFVLYILLSDGFRVYLPTNRFLLVSTDLDPDNENLCSGTERTERGALGPTFFICVDNVDIFVVSRIQ